MKKTAPLALVCLVFLAACGRMDLGKIEIGKPYVGLYQGRDCVVVLDHVTENNVTGHAYLDNGGVEADSVNFSAKLERNGRGHCLMGGKTNKLKVSAKEGMLEGVLCSGEDKADFSLKTEPAAQQDDMPAYKRMYMDPVYAVSEELGRVYATGVEGYWTSYPDSDEEFSEIYLHKVKDLVSSKKLNLDMDLYYPDERVTGCTRPLLILIHGGAFYNDDKRQAVGYPEMGRHFASRGFVVASINYRMGFKPLAADVDRAGYRALQDAHAAVCYLIENAPEFGIDTTRIFAAGSSAGAITALNLAFMREKNRPASTTSGGAKKWISSKVKNLTGALNRIASLFGRTELIDSQKFVDALGLNSDLGNIGAVSGSLDRPFHINAVVNLWGAVHTLEMLKNSKETAILSFHGDEDHIVPFGYGYPFDNTFNPDLMEELPSWMQPVMEAGKSWRAKDKPINEWVFNPMYGSSMIHNKALSLGMHSELHTCHGGGHSLHKDENKHLSKYFYNTILPNMTRFLCDEAVGGVRVHIAQVGGDGRWFEAVATDNVKELHWHVSGGAIVDRQSDNKIRVLFFPDSPKHSVSVYGKYANGAEFSETWNG